jgi:hypothetical protein
MRKQREKERLADGIPAADGPAEQFDNALWLDGTSRAASSGKPPLLCFTSPVRGILAISSQALIFLPKDPATRGAPPNPIRVPLADIAAVSEITTEFVSLVSVDVKRRDGSYVAFALCAPREGGPDNLRVKAARALLEKRLSKSLE